MNLHTRYPFDGVLTVPTPADLPAVAADGTLAVSLSNDSLYMYDAVTLTWLLLGTGGGGAVNSVNGGVQIGITGPATDPVVNWLGAIHDATLTGTGLPGDPLHVVGSSLEFAIPVRAGTTAALAGTWTYNNGVGGVGATLTRTTNGVLPAQDGITLAVNDDLLVKDQAAQLQNGVYKVTQLGSVGTPTILTRTTNSDETVEFDDQIVIVELGTTLAGQIFGQITVNPVVGTNPIVYQNVTGLYVTQQIAGTQVAGQIPVYTGVARQITKGTPNLTFASQIFTMIGQLRLGGSLTATIAADQNNYNPAGLATATNLLISATGASRTITGLAGGATGRTIFFHNQGTNNIVFPHDSALSTAANRFSNVGGQSLTVFPNQLLVLQYDSGSQRWKTTGAISANLQAGTYAAIDALRTTSALIPGRFYLITDRANTGIIVQADAVNQLSLYAMGGYLNPDYQAVGVYSGVAGFSGQQGVWSAANEALPYVTGNVVIWNGNHYVVNAAGVFNGTDPTVNTTKYTLLARSTTTGFIEEWDALRYDFPHDWVDMRMDKRNNEIGGSWNYEQNFAANGFNVIEKFQWGSDRAVGNICHESLVDILNSYGSYHHNTVTEFSAFRANTLQSSTCVNNTISKNSNINAASMSGFFVGNNIESSGIAAMTSLAQFTYNSISAGSSIDVSNMGNKQFSQNVIQGSTVSLTNFNGGAIKFNNNIITNGCIVDMTDATCNVLYNKLNLTTVNGPTCASTFSNNDMVNSTINCEVNTNWIVNNKIDSATIFLTNNANRFFNNIVRSITILDFTNNVGMISNCRFLDGANVTGTDNAGDISYVTVDQNSTLTITNNTAGISNVEIVQGSTLVATQNAQQIFQGRIFNGSIIFADANRTQLSNFILNNTAVLLIASSSGGTVDQIIIENGSTFDLSNNNASVSQITVKNSSTINAPTIEGTLAATTVQDQSTLNMLTQGADGIISGCTISDRAVVDATGNDGLIRSCTFDSGINVTCFRKTSSYSLTDCKFSNGFTVTIPDATTFRGELLERGKNTFSTSFDITGLTTLDMTTINWAGVILLTSTNASESLTRITNSVNSWPYTFVPEDGLDVTFVASPVASAAVGEIILEVDTDVNLVGRPIISDKLILQNESDIHRQVAGSII